MNTRRSSSTMMVIGILSLGALSACGGGVDSGTGGTSTTTSSSSGGGGTGGTVPAGDCESDADCDGGKCGEVTPGGYAICLRLPPEATMCHAPGGPIDDLCCDSSECTGGGKCYSSYDVPYCGGAAPAEYNACFGDACTNDGDCQGAGVTQICAPPGAFGQPARACVVAYCKTDADCTARAGGRCAPIAAPCCATPAGLACVYPGGCKDQDDCGNDGMKHCEIDETSHEGTCAPGPAACPA